MVGTLTEPFAGRMKKSDWPERVIPPSTQVARARTWPKFAGMLGSTQVPSGFTETLRFSPLTTQFSLSWADAGSGVTANTNARNGAIITTRLILCHCHSMLFPLRTDPDFPGPHLASDESGLVGRPADHVFGNRRAGIQTRVVPKAFTLNCAPTNQRTGLPVCEPIQCGFLLVSSLVRSPLVQIERTGSPHRTALRLTGRSARKSRRKA